MSFSSWKNQHAYIGEGCLEQQQGTMQEAMLRFFYDGLSPWIKGYGYRWLQEDSIVAGKFVYLCYMIDITARDYNKSLAIPFAQHRDLQEDRDTFDYIVDSYELVKFLEAWNFRSEVVGTRFDHLLKEFCYIWIDVTAGKPGTFTQKIFDGEAEIQAEEELAYGPDITSRKKWDLY